MVLEVLLVQDEFEEGYVQKKGICRTDQAAQLCLEIKTIKEKKERVVHMHLFHFKVTKSNNSVAENCKKFSCSVAECQSEASRRTRQLWELFSLDMKQLKGWQRKVYVQSSA